MDNRGVSAATGVLGAGLAVAFVVLVIALVGVWPVRVSDVPGAAGTICDVQASPLPTASPGGKSPAPTPTPSVLPSTTPEQQRSIASAQAQALDPWSRCGRFLGIGFTLPFELRLILIVALSAALGSFVHMAWSFTTFLGRGQFDARWLWWYVLRIPIGAGLAVIVYFALRGGLLTTSSMSDTVVNPFGVCGIAALVGLFSRQAMEKLEETFTTMFRTAPKPPTLAIASVTPSTFAHAAPPAALAVTGTAFTTTTQATINGASRNVVYTGPMRLDVQLAPPDTAAPGTLRLELTDQGARPVATTITVT